MSTDKNDALITYLKQCPQLSENPLFFNFAKGEDNNKQLLLVANERILDRPNIDGSVKKRFTFTIVDYRSVVYQALAEVGGELLNNENMEDLLDVQAIIDWIDTQNDNQNYPNFGNNCIIESIASQTDNPNLNGVDTNVKPSLAKYHVSIIIDYVDTSKVLWNKEE